VVEQFLSEVLSAPNAPVAAGAAAAGLALLMAVAAVAAVRRQRTLVARLDDRLAHLSAGVSLLTNTTEDGLRAIAMEVSRLAGASEARPNGPLSTRQRIAAAAGHGRSVQDIAASEQVSEGEVLLHLLLDKLKPESPQADAC
jgi:hypothetical protein